MRAERYITRCSRIALVVTSLVVVAPWTAASQPAATSGPILLVPPGQVVPLPTPGTPSQMPLPDYDKDEDNRNEWSRKEFPHWGECRWMPVEWGGKPLDTQPGTVAQRQAVRQSLEKAIAFLQTAPVGNPPIGICPWVVRAGADGRLDQGLAFESSFQLANWGSKTLSRRTPGGRVSRGELLHLGFTFNQMPGQRISPEGPFQDGQGEFFAQGQPDGLFQGFPAYFSLGNPDENFLVIPRNNRPLFRPVAVGRMIRWQLAQFDEELKRLSATIESAKRQYDSYFSATGKAEEERIVGIRIERERATTPEAQARIRANRDAENAAAIKKLREQWDAAANPEHPFSIATRRRAEAQARLASLPADEAQRPACLIKREQSYITPDIAPSGTATCAFTLVERNPDYYDKTLPPTALQLLVLSRFSWLPPIGGLPGDRRRYTWANRHTIWGLDWQKFRRDVLGATEPFDIAKVTPYADEPRSLPDSVRSAQPRETVTSPDSPALAPPGPGALPAPAGTFRLFSTEPPTLQPVNAVFRTAQPIEVRFSGMSGELRDWVAIAKAGAPAEQYGEWQYFDGKVSGVVRFTRALPPGQYEVRAFHPGAARSSSLKATATFDVR